MSISTGMPRRHRARVVLPLLALLTVSGCAAASADVQPAVTISVSPDAISPDVTSSDVTSAGATSADVAVGDAVYMERDGVVRKR